MNKTECEHYIDLGDLCRKTCFPCTEDRCPKLKKENNKDEHKDDSRTKM